MDNMSLIKKIGYNCVFLYTEDTYEIDEPFFGYLRGNYRSKASGYTVQQWHFCFIFMGGLPYRVPRSNKPVDSIFV